MLKQRQMLSQRKRYCQLIQKHSVRERRRQTVSLNGKHECEPSQKTFYDKPTLNRHMKSKHEGVMYSCNQCDYQAGYQGHLTIHIQTKHEGIKYACDQCDYQAGYQGHLTTHIHKRAQIHPTI